MTEGDDYDYQERMAIRAESGMTEGEAIRADKGDCAAVKRIQELRDRERQKKYARSDCGKDKAGGR